MNKKITAFTVAFLMVFVMAFPVFASQDDAAKDGTAGETASVTHIVDNEKMLSKKNKAKLESAAEKVYEKNGVEVFGYLTGQTLDDAKSVSLTVYQSSARTDAAIILLYDANKVYLYVYGRAENDFTDEELQDIKASAKAEDTYLKSFSKYIEMTSSLLDEKGVQPIPSERQQPRLVDRANLVSGSDETALLAKLDEISEARQIDVVIVTENAIGDKTPTQYADDFYDYNGFGFNDSRDGILLLISMENRDWAISTHGLGIDIFTDAGQEYMTDRFVSYLSDGDYYGGFDCFADLCDQFIAQYQETGVAYDVGNLPKAPFAWGFSIFISLAVGLLAGLITALVFKSELTSVKIQPSAVGYTKPDSLHLTERNDMFLYHVVNRTARPKDTDSGHSGGGGGSSTHHSSSGSTHGGSHGHF